MVVGESDLLVIHTHEKLIQLLKEHQAMGTETQLARLGILTNPFFDAALIEQIAFTEYGDMNELNELLPEQHPQIYEMITGEKQ